MVADSSFEEKVKELEQWFQNHDSLPEKIGKIKIIDFVVVVDVGLKNMTV